LELQLQIIDHFIDLAVLRGNVSQRDCDSSHHPSSAQRCQPSQFLLGRTGRRQNCPSRPSMSMTARRPGTCRGRHKPRPRQSSTVPGRHRAVRLYTWIKPNEALIACGKIYKYRDALYLCIKPLCKSESKDKWSVYKEGRSTCSTKCLSATYQIAWVMISFRLVSVWILGATESDMVKMEQMQNDLASRSRD
jgi:hypothetical protein